jgi:hypothetical protein
MPQFLQPAPGSAGTLDDQLSGLWRLLGSNSLSEVAASGTREVLRREGDRALVVRDMVLVPGLPDTEYTPRGLAIGLKNGFSLLFDTDRLCWLAAWRGGFLYRTKSGRLWEWHPETSPFWTAPKRLPPVVLVGPDGTVRTPREVRERFGSFRALEFVRDGVTLTYRLDFDAGPVSVMELIKPQEGGWTRSVAIADVPDGFQPALVEQPEGGSDRVRLAWPPDASTPWKVPGAPGALVLKLGRPDGGAPFEQTVGTTVVPGS